MVQWQNTEAAIEFDVVPNTKKQHEVNVGKNIIHE